MNHGKKKKKSLTSCFFLSYSIYSYEEYTLSNNCLAPSWCHLARPCLKGAHPAVPYLRDALSDGLPSKPDTLDLWGLHCGVPWCCVCVPKLFKMTSLDVLTGQTAWPRWRADLNSNWWQRSPLSRSDDLLGQRWALKSRWVIQCLSAHSSRAQMAAWEVGFAGATQAETVLTYTTSQ